MTLRLAVDTKGTSDRGVAAAFDHFRLRLGQRFGAGLDALALWKFLVSAYRAENWSLLRPIMRVNREGRRLFAVDLSDGRTVYVIFCCNVGMPVTVMSKGMAVTIPGKGTITLGEFHGVR